MTEGVDFADSIQTRLEAISGFTGRVYTYIPPIREEKDTKAYFVEDSTTGEKRLNTWFVNRVRLISRKYGEERRIPTRHRVRHHVYQISGFISLIAEEVNSTVSEHRFQNLVDQVEEAFAVETSFGYTDRTVLVTGFDAEIRYRESFGVLCHTAVITMTVTEYVQTSYIP